MMPRGTSEPSLFRIDNDSPDFTRILPKSKEKKKQKRKRKGSNEFYLIFGCIIYIYIYFNPNLINIV